MSKLYLPAEWEKQNAIQLTWPHGDTDWKEYLDEADSTYVQMAIQRSAEVIKNNGCRSGIGNSLFAGHGSAFIV